MTTIHLHSGFHLQDLEADLDFIDDISDDDLDENTRLTMQVSDDNFAYCNFGEEPRFVFDEGLPIPAQIMPVADLRSLIKSPITCMTASYTDVILSDGHSIFVFDLSTWQCKRNFRILPRGFRDFNIAHIQARPGELLYTSGQLVPDLPGQSDDDDASVTVGALLMTSMMGRVFSYKIYADGLVGGFDFDQSGNLFLCYTGQRKASSRIIKLSGDLKHIFHLDIEWDKKPKQVSCSWDSNETWVSGNWGTAGGFLLNMKSDDTSGSAQVSSWLRPTAWRFERLFPGSLLRLGEGQLLGLNQDTQDDGSLYILYWTRRVPGSSSQGWVPECQRLRHKDNNGISALCADPHKPRHVLLARSGRLFQMHVPSGGCSGGNPCSIS